MTSRNVLRFLAGFIFYVISASATAVPFGDAGTGLQTALDNITNSPTPGVSSTNVLTDAITDSQDSYWSIHGSGGSVVTLITEVDVFAATNTFGIFDLSNPNKRVQIFGGGATSGSQALITIDPDGSVKVNFVDTGIDFAANAFGYYIDSTLAPQPWSGGVWYSDTSLNSDHLDHMAAYQGKGIDTIQIPPYSPGIWDIDEYILSFESLHAMHWGNGNGSNDGYPEWSDTEPDYDDLVVMVESVESVESIPEPATLILLLLGIAGIGYQQRKGSAA